MIFGNPHAGEVTEVGWPAVAALVVVAVVVILAALFGDSNDPY